MYNNDTYDSQLGEIYVNCFSSKKKKTFGDKPKKLL